jgi:hypothetical protein
MNPSSLMVGTVCCGFNCRKKKQNKKAEIYEWPNSDFGILEFFWEAKKTAGQLFPIIFFFLFVFRPGIFIDRQHPHAQIGGVVCHTVHGRAISIIYRYSRAKWSQTAIGSGRPII